MPHDVDVERVRPVDLPTQPLGLPAVPQDETALGWRNVLHDAACRGPEDEERYEEDPPERDHGGAPKSLNLRREEVAGDPDEERIDRGEVKELRAFVEGRLPEEG